LPVGDGGGDLRHLVPGGEFLSRLDEWSECGWLS
jgi:hypothetical protein